MEDVTKVTPQSTKKEILDAYEELMRKYETVKDSRGKSKEVKQSEEKEIVQKAISYPSGDITQKLAELRLDIARRLEEIGVKMLEKDKELKQLEEAIAIESKRLEEIHQIHGEADTLADLLRLHQDEKKKFQEEIDALKSEYERKKAVSQQQLEEEQTQAERKRQKAEEEYDYNLKIKRKKEQDAFSEESTKKRRELEEEIKSKLLDLEAREKQVAAKEAECDRLKAQVAGFGKVLEDKVKATENHIRQELEREFKHEKEILVKTVEGEKRLSDLRIENLTSAMEKLQSENNKLKEELQSMSKQIQEIALKTIEGHSSRRANEVLPPHP